MRKILGLIALSAMAAAIPIFSQAPGGAKPSFEVATVKANTSGAGRVAILGSPGGRIASIGTPLRMLITYAYRLRDFQVSGGPAWIATDRWDLEARAAEGSVPPPTGFPDPNVPDGMALRMQSLLEDRFQLKFHKETKELPVYELTVAKGGSKLKLNEDQSPFRLPERGDEPPPRPQRGGTMPRGNISMGRGNFEGRGVPFSALVQVLSQQIGRTIINKTDIGAGLYDFKLQWTPDVGQGGGPVGPPPPGVEQLPVDPNGPSIFTAIQEQLGLKLESTKGPVEVMVIDSVQKPTEN